MWDTAAGIGETPASPAHESAGTLVPVLGIADPTIFLLDKRNIY
jgi:hypothetical protein